MGLENIREIKFRYVLNFPKNKKLKFFIRTLKEIEDTKDFPLIKNVQIIAKNQFVNVRDIKGHDLFENDVVSLEAPFSSNCLDNNVIGEIRWKYGAFVVEGFNSPGISYPLQTGKIKKLGDIYHNKSLVDEAKKKTC